jgi:methylated-DNA-[protein]-cysteine S-methyltransferase
MADRAIYDAVIPAPFGRVGVRLREGRVVDIGLLSARASLRAPQDRLTRSVCAELARYFSDPAHIPKVPLALDGTPFQRRVWRLLQRIPSGTTASYGELARRLGSSPRAVGGACRANPVPIVVPCHRVVSHAGLGGFMGHQSGPAMRIKERLLAHERRR